MSDANLQNIKQTKELLDKVSPSFCLAKWSMVTIHLQQGETHSCYHPWTHKIPLEEIKNNPSALHNTEFKKQQRKLMLEGVRPAECQYCWNIEDLKKDFVSDRMIRSNEDWAKPDFEKISKLPWDANINPRHVEMSFDSVCQLKCIYCNPTVSSKWLEEVKEYGGFKTSNAFNDYMSEEKIQERFKQLNEPNPYVEAFWKWWPSLYPDLRIFRLTGGEPLLSKETFKVLDFIAENPHPDLEVIINSNLCAPDGLIDKMIEKANIALKKKNIKLFTIFGSIDTQGDQAEYIRTGLDYGRFMKNVERVLNEIPDSKVAFTVTYNALSVPRFHLLLEKVLELRKKYNVAPAKRVLFDTPYLRFPDHLSIQVLPLEFSKYFEKQIAFMEANKAEYTGFEELEILKIRGIFEWMKQGAGNQEQLKKAQSDFVIYFKEHDRRRKTDFTGTFPELAEFYSELQAKV